MKQKLNDHPETLSVGDLVVTDFYDGAENVVRRLLSIEPCDDYGSGYKASASAGYGTPRLEKVDAAWFLPAPKGARPIDKAEVNRLTAELTAAVADLALNAGMLARQTDLARQAESDRDEYKRRADDARAARPWSGYVAEIHEADADWPAVALVEFSEGYDALWLPLSDVPEQSCKLGSRCCIEWCADTWTHDEIYRAKAAAAADFAVLTNEPPTKKEF